MTAAEGVGLAANQVGVDLAVFVFSCPDEFDEIRSGVVCNPVVEVQEGRERRLDESEEGCLSLPGAFVPLARPERAVVRGVDHLGASVRYEAGGLLARCLQHESDHLVGTVFADRLGRRSRRRLFAEAESTAEQFPPDWPVAHRQLGRVPDTS